MRAACALILVLLLSANLAVAKLCGDDVAGADVACGCGDVVVSDVVLDDDPVAVTVCDGDGLLIRAPGAEPINVDLGGKTLRGNRSGHGIRVLHGGVGGARVTGGAQRSRIEGFDHGVVSAADDLAVLENVDVRGVAHDGIRVRGSGLVRNCTVSRAGRDGFALGGRGFRARGNRSRDNHRHGFMLMGHDGQLDDNHASNCGGAGFVVTGGGHSIADCVAESCGKNGLSLVTSGATIHTCVAKGNLASGIEGHGSSWRLAGNTATDNGEYGIKARGPDMIDEGGNKGSGNGADQCTIGTSECAAP